jgi:hypothetical protein
MPTFTEPELAALLAGLHYIQDRLAARRIAPDSITGKLLTKDGAYGFPTADDLEPLREQLIEAAAAAPAAADPLPTAIEAVIKLVLLHPLIVFTPEAIKEQGYDNLTRYVDQMLADSNEEALISQEVVLVTAPRPLTEEEHEIMYGDLPYPNPTEEEEEETPS